MTLTNKQLFTEVLQCCKNPAYLNKCFYLCKSRADFRFELNLVSQVIISKQSARII